MTPDRKDTDMREDLVKRLREATWDLEQAADEIEALRARAEAAEAERDDALRERNEARDRAGRKDTDMNDDVIKRVCAALDDGVPPTLVTLRALRARAEAAEAERDRLREAIRQLPMLDRDDTEAITTLAAWRKLRAALKDTKDQEGWRELHQENQPLLADGYTAIKVHKPGVWMVKGPGPIKDTEDRG